MALRFVVPKFIMIEDKLVGLVTFKQLFALLGAFLLSFIFFKINKLLGIIVGLLSFGIAVLFTFVYVNGKLFIYVLPSFLEFFLGGQKYVWKRYEKFAYKEVPLPEVSEEGISLTMPQIERRQRLIGGNVISFNVNYASGLSEELSVALDKPLSEQVSKLTVIEHKHTLNPRNPYKFFPYIKFYRSNK